MAVNYKTQITWAKNHVTQLSIKLNNNTDADIISHLGRIDNRQGYIKDLIRADINKKQEH